MTYLLIKTLHLLAAIAFIGTLFFQVLILTPVTRRLDPAVRELLSPALGQQARHVVHVAAILLYGAGLMLAWPYRTRWPIRSPVPFATLLTLENNPGAVDHRPLCAADRSAPASADYRAHVLLNVSLLLHAVLLVICAKSMFVL